MNKERKKSRERKVKFPHELVFDDMIKDGDSSEIVHFLRRQSVDVDINKTTDSGTTPLNDLIKNGNLKCARTLINVGADINRKDKDGLTPLHIAVQNGCVEVVEFLLEYKANTEIKDGEGLLPVDYTDDFEMVELLTSYSVQQHSNEIHQKK
eukprot:gene17405-19148_t